MQSTDLELRTQREPVLGATLRDEATADAQARSCVLISGKAEGSMSAAQSLSEIDSQPLEDLQVGVQKVEVGLFEQIETE